MNTSTVIPTSYIRADFAEHMQWVGTSTVHCVCINTLLSYWRQVFGACDLEYVRQ